MAGGKSEESALETARVRFVASLPRKSVELSTAVQALADAPAETTLASELRRRLHALYASALVFRMVELCTMLEHAIAHVDRGLERNAGCTADELSELARSVIGLEASAQVSAEPVADDSDDEPSQIMRTPLAGAALAGGASAMPVLTRTLRVLLLARGDRTDIHRALETMPVEIDVVPDTDALLQSAREDAPDVVLADAALAHAGHLAAQLRGDPFTDYLPIVLFRGPAQNPLALDTLRSHVDAVVTTPLDTAELTRVLGRVTGTLLDESRQRVAASARITVEELAANVAETVRRGILDAAEGAHGVALNVEDDSPVRAAALAAVASVRAFVEERSFGKVRFDGRADGAHPGLLQLAGSFRDDVDTSVLSGRRVLVADDDTGVLVLLSGLLRAEGATVVEAADGDETLASARSERPDLIITDVVMPGRDGLSLCRELARDPLLADVPVLLISAKDELLVCAREVAAGSPAAVRREQLGRRVLTQAALTLAPRVALEQELRSGGEVRGSLASIGVVALLRCVRRHRPEARITLRDAWNAFEVLLSDGRVARLTRTASDGSFVRDEQALPQLVGMGHGRFAVETAEPIAKAGLLGTLDEVLARAAEELAIQLGAVALPQLSTVSRVVFDEDAVGSLSRHGHAVLGRVVNALHRGASVAELTADEAVALPLVSSLLADLTRRGAVRHVFDALGVDVVERARDARISRARTAPLSRIPPAPDPVISVLAPAAHALPPPEPVHSEPAERAPEPAALESGRPRPALPSFVPSALPARSNHTAGWAVALVALMALGFLLGRWREHRTREALVASSEDAVARVGAPSVVPAADAPSAPLAAPPVAPAVVSVTPAAALEPPFIAPEDVGFHVTLGVPSEIQVGAGQGVVSVASLVGVHSASLAVDDRPIGPIPVKIALPEGIHELAIQHGDAVTYRFVSVRPGRTYTLSEL